MQTIRITTSQNIDIDYEVASLGDRILARLIDLGILTAIYILVLLTGILGMDGYGKIAFGLSALVLICMALFAFYDLICEIWMNGQSIGKKAMKIRVISLDGGRPSIGQYLIRWLFRIVDFLITFQLAALLSAILTDKKQRIGDIVAGTCMVRTVARTQSAALAFMPPKDDYIPVFSQVSRLTDRDIVLVHEVLANYATSGNSILLYNTATKVKQHLSVTSPPHMDDLLFLQTIIKDYNYVTARADH